MNLPRDVTIFGTGAMACLVGAHLGRSGLVSPLLVGSWDEGLTALAADGIAAEDGRQQWTARVAACSVTEVLPQADLVLVLTKSYRTSAVAAQVARAVRSSGLVITLQNGLGNREILASVLGIDPVGLGVTSMGATLLAPGRVRCHPGVTTFGLEPLTAASIERAAVLLSRAGLEVTLDSNLEALVWRKLAVNCAINPVSALLDVSNGELLERPDALTTMLDAAREVEAVARARNIDVGANVTELVADVARRTAHNLSSMLQDVRRGAPTEIDTLSAAVGREGRRLGVPTPVNEWLWRAVTALTAREGSRIPEPGFRIQNPAS